MKKFLLLPALIAAFVLFPASLRAQQDDFVLRQDTAVRAGKLPNGLTYYIRHNSLVPDRAEFYIAQNVGSILENPSQRGLAHFLEHMAFNGTRNFPDKQIIDYLEKIGVKFGANLNAYTGVDATVYNMNEVPVVRSGVIDSCLLILRDWSDGISLLDGEIDNERKVIEEEWRTRNNNFQRMYEKVLPEVYGGDKYADCMPIGSMDVVRNFPYDTLRAYYHRWYRPDLQAIIVVGDVDADYVENKIKETFASCKKDPSAPERIWYPVSDNKEPLISFTTDPENSYAMMWFMQKHEAYPKEGKNKFSYRRQLYVEELASQIMNRRLSELVKKADPPFVSAAFYDGEFLVSPTKDAFTLFALCSEQKMEGCFAAAYREYEIMRRHGFTAGEFEWAKQVVYAEAEKVYNERSKRYNVEYVNECLANFQNAEPLLSAEDDFLLVSLLGETVTLAELNAYAMGSGNENSVLWLSGPESDSYKFPEKAGLIALMDSISSAELPAYADEDANKSLISKEIREGKIKSKKRLADGITEYRLSNGVRVLLKPTDFKDDEILLAAVGEGAMSLESTDDAPTYAIINDMATVGGLGDFSETELSRYLAAKQVGLSLNFGIYEKTLSGSSSVKDLETLFQLIYLQLTDIRRDDELFESYRGRLSDILRNQQNNPAITFIDSIIMAEWDNHPYALRLSDEMLAKADYAKGLEILKRRLARPSELTFVFTGNVDTLAFEPLLTKYIASLPSKGRESSWQNCGYAPAPGQKMLRYERKAETDKASVYMSMHDDMPYTLDNYMALSALEHIMDIMFFDEVRERAGGTYGVRTSSSFSRYPSDYFMFEISFDCEPGKVDTLLPIVSGVIEDLALGGPSQVNLDKAKEYLLKVYKDNQRENGYWQGVMLNRDVRGINLHDGYDEAVRKLTAEDLRRMAKILDSQPNYKEVIQLGVSGKEEAK